jgi:hypothetical protein
MQWFKNLLDSFYGTQHIHDPGGSASPRTYQENSGGRIWPARDSEFDSFTGQSYFDKGLP